jgi:hypothetical protein
MVVLPVNSEGMLGGLGAFAILGALATKVRAAAMRDVATYPAACGRVAHVLCDVPRAHQQEGGYRRGSERSSATQPPPSTSSVSARGSGGQRPVDRTAHISRQTGTRPRAVATRRTPRRIDTHVAPLRDLGAPSRVHSTSPGCGGRPSCSSPPPLEGPVLAKGWPGAAFATRQLRCGGGQAGQLQSGGGRMLAGLTRADTSRPIGCSRPSIVRMWGSTSLFFGFFHHFRRPC